MSSVSAQQGGGVFSKTPYSAAEAGILGLTRSLAREMAPHRITVNAVSPGVVDTDIRSGATDPENEAKLAAKESSFEFGVAAKTINLTWKIDRDKGQECGRNMLLSASDDVVHPDLYADFH